MKKPVIIFDFDGTIAKTLPVLFDIANALSDDYHFRKIDDREIEVLRGMTAREAIKEIGISKWRLFFLARKLKSELRQDIDKVDIVEGFSEEFQKIHRNDYTIGIITSDTEVNVERFLNAKGIRNLFSFIVSDVGIWGKAKAIRKYLKRKNLNEDEVIYVGDEIRDIEAARDSRVKIIAVPWGFNNEPALQRYNPDYLVHAPSEIMSIIQGINGKMPDSD